MRDCAILWYDNGMKEGVLAKITISLPDDYLKAIETERQATRESRSEFLRRAVQTLLRKERERVDIERYVRGYMRDPETAEELGWVEDASQDVLDEYPWPIEAGP